MHPRSSSIAYLVALIALSLLAFVAASAVRFTIDNIGCKSDGYSNGQFMAYCKSGKFSDYEHAALYFGLEPGVQANIAGAKVLFLGNSRTQAGFSSQATERYFRERGVTYYLLGTGYGEGSEFAEAVMRRARARPKVIVINADPFFSPLKSIPATQAMEWQGKALWWSLMKAAFQYLQPVACSLIRCPDTVQSIFRSRRTGAWDWIGHYVEDKSVPIDAAKQRPTLPAALSDAVTIGNRMLDGIGISRNCVVFTGIPNEDVDAPAVAAKLAASLKTKLIVPPIDGLKTIDGSHLNREGAERWSSKFLDELTPVLNACL